MSLEITREVSRTEDIRYGRCVVGTSAVRLTEPSTPDQTGKGFRGVLLSCSTSNTSPIYVGGPTVSSADGFPVRPGNFLEMPVDDPSLIYLIADDADQNVAWISV